MLTPIRHPLWIAVIVSLLSICTAKSAEKETGTLIELPPFVVEESLTPPWRYASIPGVEIISRTPDRLTRQLITGHHRLHTILALMIPPELQLQRDTPLHYVIYIEENQSAVTREMVASIEEQEKEALGRSSHGNNFNAADVSVGYMPNFRFWDQDSLSIFFVVDLNSDDRDEITLSASYVRYLLEDRTPSLPRWYLEGMMELYPSAFFSEPPLETSSNPALSQAITKTKTARIGLTMKAFTWGSDRESKLLKKNPRKAPDLLPLATLFTLTAADLGDPSKQNLWKSQSALFIRWALDPQTQKNRMAKKPFAEALRDFVSRNSIEPPTEQLFQECFRMNYREADAELKAYLPNALRQSFDLYPDKSIAPASYTLRDASALEISRIKGGLARLEIGYVRARYPALTNQYIAQARRVLRSAYDQGIRDPELLVELGLTECDALNDPAARPYLREATTAGVIRPRAYYELARIEHEQLSKQGKTAKSAPKEYRAVFNLLQTARQLSPSLVEIYELSIRIWMEGEVEPTDEIESILKEAFRFHPRHQKLILAAALYRTMFWQTEAAQSLVTRGLESTTSPNERTKLLKLRTMIAEAARQPSS